MLLFRGDVFIRLSSGTWTLLRQRTVLQNTKQLLQMSVIDQIHFRWQLPQWINVCGYGTQQM